MKVLLLVVLLLAPVLAYADSSGQVDTIKNTPVFAPPANSDIAAAFQAVLTQFMSDVTNSPNSIFSVFDPMKKVDLGGASSSMYFDFGRYGKHTVDVSAWPPMIYSILKGIVLISCMFVAVRVVTGTN